MTDDIVTRLRKQYVGNYNALLWDEAADEIERLRTELVRNADEFRETLTELRQRVETLIAERGWDCLQEVRNDR